MPSRLPERIYSPASQLSDLGRFVQELRRDARLTRELAWRLFQRDFLAQYRQSILGVVWALVPPVLTAATFILLRQQQILNIEETAVPYFLFVTSGTVLWQTFLDALNSPLQAVSTNRSILTKVNFPREAILLAGVYNVLTAFGFRTLLLGAAFLLAGIVPGWHLLLFPLGLLGLLCLGFALGLALTPLGVLFGDIGRIIGMIGPFWLLLTPVVYPPPETGWGALAAQLNPVSPMLVTARDWLVGTSSGFTGIFAAIFGVAFCTLVLGWLVYRLSLPHLVARMGS